MPHSNYTYPYKLQWPLGRMPTLANMSRLYVARLPNVVCLCCGCGQLPRPLQWHQNYYGTPDNMHWMHHFDLLQATLHNVVCLTSPAGICFSPSRSRAPHSSVTTANGYDDYPSAHATVSVTLFTRAALMRARHKTVAPVDRLLRL